MQMKCANLGQSSLFLSPSCLFPLASCQSSFCLSSVSSFCPSFCLSFCLSSFYVPVRTCMCDFLSICLPVLLPVCLCISVFLSLPVLLSICIFVCLHVLLSLCLFVCLSVCLFIFLSAILLVCDATATLPIFPSVFLFHFLSVCSLLPHT